MERIDDTRQLLLISNSTLHGSGYLDHAEKEIRDFVGGKTTVLFVPYAVHDRRVYAAKAEERLGETGLSATSIHNASNMPRAVGEAEVIFVVGRNTFRPLKGLHDHDLLGPIRQRVAADAPYIGASAGSIVACPSLKTTKDTPVVQSPSVDALGLVSFQISPLYLDPDPATTHMGETQEERIMRFLEENEAPEVGLREGSILLVRESAVVLKGPNRARIFRRAEGAVEPPSGSNLRLVLDEVLSPIGRVA
jgi:dipeptidase E